MSDKKTILTLIFAVIFFTACNRSPKDFSSVEIGMTKEEVIATAGEPDKQNDVGETSFWSYPSADRTVVFRGDTVYTIVTSAEARIDSIQTSLERAGQNIEENFRNLSDSFDSTSEGMKDNIDRDTTGNR